MNFKNIRVNSLYYFHNDICNNQSKNFSCCQGKIRLILSRDKNKLLTVPIYFQDIKKIDEILNREGLGYSLFNQTKENFQFTNFCELEVAYNEKQKNKKISSFDFFSDAKEIDDDINQEEELINSENVIKILNDLNNF